MPYKIYTQVNLADTSRDPDDYIYSTLGYRKNIIEAMMLADEYINTRFTDKNTMLRKVPPNKEKILYTATDFCSYGATIMIKEIPNSLWAKLKVKFSE